MSACSYFQYAEFPAFMTFYYYILYALVLIELATRVRAFVQCRGVGGASGLTNDSSSRSLAQVQNWYLSVFSYQSSFCISTIKSAQDLTEVMTPWGVEKNSRCRQNSALASAHV